MVSATRRRVLVIDGDPDVRAALVQVLVDAGHEVSECGDRETGLSLAKTRKPQLILLDHKMPGSPSAEEFFERLRSDPETANIEVIVLGGPREPGRR